MFQGVESTRVAVSIVHAQSGQQLQGLLLDSHIRCIEGCNTQGTQPSDVRAITRLSKDFPASTVI